MSNTSDTNMHANHAADANLHGEKDYQTMAQVLSGSVLNMPIILTSATKWVPFR